MFAQGQCVKCENVTRHIKLDKQSRFMASHKENEEKNNYEIGL